MFSVRTPTCAALANLINYSCDTATLGTRLASPIVYDKYWPIWAYGKRWSCCRRRRRLRPYDSRLDYHASRHTTNHQFHSESCACCRHAYIQQSVPPQITCEQCRFDRRRFQIERTCRYVLWHIMHPPLNAMLIDAHRSRNTFAHIPLSKAFRRIYILCNRVTFDDCTTGLMFRWPNNDYYCMYRLIRDEWFAFVAEQKSSQTNCVNPEFLYFVIQHSICQSSALFRNRIYNTYS